MEVERLKTREQITSQIQSRQVILTPDGDVLEMEALNDEKRKETLIKYGLSFSEDKNNNEKRLSTKLVELMVAMKWLDSEKASGKGHFRFYPRGATVHSILENVFDNFSLNELEARRVITPLVFNWDDEQINQEIGTFYKNLYHVQPGANPESGQQVLRFGFDMGVFKLMQNVNLRESNLPVRIYETGMVLRSNKPGEKNNIQRADSFHIPSIYSFCGNDLSEGLKEFSYMHNRFSDFLNRLGLDFGYRFEIDEKFFADYKNQILSILNYENKPALIGLVSNKRHYFEVKSDHIVDRLFKSFNIQLDNENATNYNIRYHQENGNVEEQVPCTIIHSSLASMERWMLILLSKSLKQNPPELPLWFSPIQIRIIPLGNEYDNSVVNLAKSLSSQGVRVDIDDRNEKVNNKIKYADRALIPYVVLFGENEEQSKTINLRKKDKTLVPCALTDVPEFIKSQIGGSRINLTTFLSPVTRLSKEILLP